MESELSKMSDRFYVTQDTHHVIYEELANERQCDL